MSGQPRYSADEFDRESRYIDNLIWDALVIEQGDDVLFCGYGDDARWIKRALEAGATVTVIEHRDEVLRRYEDLGAAQLRGSTSVIPAKTGSFDLAVAFHYLHECDPFFHAQIVSELARVASRVAIVEPGPPADRLGKRIARLYSQAKRELGQFEYYQPLEYWRKLLNAVKADIAQHVFAFAKVPPQEYLRDTIDLLLATMKAEDAPEDDLKELREMASRSESMILPPARFVIVGAAAGDLPQPVFTPREEPTPTPAVARESIAATPLQAVVPAAQPDLEQATPQGDPFATPAPAPPLTFQPPPPPTLEWASFAVPAEGTVPGVPPTPGPPTGAPFAMPGTPDMPAAPPSFGLPWQWEPPEDGEAQP